MRTLTVALGGFVGQVYGVKALQENNGFTNAQCKCLLIVTAVDELTCSSPLIRIAAAMNLVETTLNVFYLYLAHVAKYPAASVVGFASVTMTLWKTVLYLLQEYYCNLCAVGHNDLKTLVVYWIIPNG
jgi:hypothetical protein